MKVPSWRRYRELFGTDPERDLRDESVSWQRYADAVASMLAATTRPAEG